MEKKRMDKLKILLSCCIFATIAASAEDVAAVPQPPFPVPQSSYTNHAGNVVSGVVVALDARTTTISNAIETLKLPLSIFPESEQRRIAADFGQPRLPVAVKRAIAGADKAMARSRKRAEKGLCKQDESDAFCAKSEAALKNYLDKQVESGTITPAERKALGR